jgi:hypothetical protein
VPVYDQSYFFADQTQATITLVDDEQPSTIPYQGLIAHYSFDNSSNLGLESTGNHNGSQSNPPPQYTSSGAINGALVLTPSNDGITIPYSTRFQTQEMSISFWFKVTTPQTGVLIARDIYGVSQSNEWFISYNAFDGLYWVSNQAIPNSNLDWPADKIALINNGEWHHFVFTIDPVSQKMGSIYFDGQLIKEQSYSNTTFNSNNEPIAIGGYKVTDSLYNAVGQIDEIRLYNRILSPSEIISLSSR